MPEPTLRLVVPPDDEVEEEEVNGIMVPAGTLLLEPRALYDPALIGVAHQSGIYYAIYSRKKTIERLVEENEAEEDPDPESDPELDAIEHYEFNVSGAIGVGYPVFILDDEPVDG